MYPRLCRSCIQREQRKTSPRNIVDMSTLTFDLENITAIDANGVRPPVKMIYERVCIREGCNRTYRQCLQQERQKKYPWHCKACAISREWNENDEYRKIHVETLTESANRPEVKRKISDTSKRNWATPHVRAAMITNRDRVAASVKGKKTFKENLLSGRTVPKVSHGKSVMYNGVRLRSTYEHRFAMKLDESKIEWIYERHPHELTSGKVYIPDFYLPHYDLYVEVKGWWRDDALEKFTDFITEYPQRRCALVMQRELELFEAGELDLETCVKKTGWCP